MISRTQTFSAALAIVVCYAVLTIPNADAFVVVLNHPTRLHSAFLINNLQSSDVLFETATSLEEKPSSLSSVIDSHAMLISNLLDEINWDNPGKSFGIIVTLVYIGISIAAGLKYIIKDGWRPKL
jgi:hypothetical protein